jgi:hypothetical protein
MIFADSEILIATWYYAGVSPLHSHLVAQISDTISQLGACGRWNTNNDHVVALPPLEYAGGTRCGRRVRLHCTFEHPPNQSAVR